MRRDIHDEAQGRWLDILSAIGIPSSALNGKHCACPCCGGKDRFRFSNLEGRGSFICSGCGNGKTGVDLVMRFKHVDFKEAVAIVREHIGSASIEAPKPAMSDERRRKMMDTLWKSSVAVVGGDPVSRYLTARVGRIRVPHTLRFVERCRYQDETPSYHPAMLAMVQNSDGKPVQLHRTYLTAQGDKANVQSVRRLMPGPIPPGSCVRLADYSEQIGIAEGIETALSAMMLFRIPCWSALNATLLAQWVPPDGVKSVTVFADNDRSFAGQRAGYELAHRLSSKFSINVRVPPQPDTDWNDVLTRGNQSEAAA
jgi:putative DNA primase/helicase